MLAIGSFFVFRAFHGSIAKREYEDIYTLVPDKISQSAAVVLRLPQGIQINTAEAKEKVSFSPALAGTWSQGKNAEYLLFQPAQKLEIRGMAHRRETQKDDRDGCDTLQERIHVKQFVGCDRQRLGEQQERHQPGPELRPEEVVHGDR